MTFNLSEKAQDGKRWLGEPLEFYLDSDVKEFIRLFKNKIDASRTYTIDEIYEIIDKLAGKKLC